jgi:repressor of nif and glnA expression
MAFNNQDVDRKVLSILKILGNARQATGARVIARGLTDLGVDLSERAVRYHLKLMDESGMTRLAGKRDGRVITEAGRTELKRALVGDKVGFAFSRIEALAFQTNFNWNDRTGSVPVNISLFQKEQFRKALKIMKPVFKAGLCVSDLAAVLEEGETCGDTMIPPGKTGLATVCSIVVNGALLKAGVPVDSKFGGILQIQKRQPRRFIELINYAGSSLDPSEIFIRAKMTSVIQAAENGNGEILANYREIPAICRPAAEEIASLLKNAGMGGLFLLGNVSEPVCEVPVDLNRVGIILIGGLNPVAAAQEAGISSDNRDMSSLMDYQKLVPVTQL